MLSIYDASSLINSHKLKNKRDFILFIIFETLYLSFFIHPFYEQMMQIVQSIFIIKKLKKNKYHFIFFIIFQIPLFWKFYKLLNLMYEEMNSNFRAKLS